MSRSARAFAKRHLASSVADGADDQFVRQSLCSVLRICWPRGIGLVNHHQKSICPLTRANRASITEVGRNHVEPYVWI